MRDFDVIVIGAGAAGLAALQALDKAGLQVLLLEARDRIGGRIHTLHDPLSSVPIELGAEFIHGRPAEIWDIIRDEALAVYDASDASRYMNDGLVERNAASWDLFGSVIEDMRKAAEGRDESFEDFLDSSTYDEETKQAARGYVEGFNAARSSDISIQALAEETAAADAIDGDRVFRFARGYDAVPFRMMRSVPHADSKVRLNRAVEHIEWQRHSVRVHTKNALSGGAEVFGAKRAVVTVSLGVLQAGSIVFSPVPDGILQAARSLCFGQVFRVVLRFGEPFWERKEELRDAGFILSNQAAFPTWWTSLAMRSPILTGWSAGAHADALIGLPREKVLAQAVESLAGITGFGDEEVYGKLQAMYFHDWHSDAYARGAYSYVPAGKADARKRIVEPCEDTLFFAGEATDQSGHAATVHGAIASGRRAAQQILR